MARSCPPTPHRLLRHVVTDHRVGAARVSAGRRSTHIEQRDRARASARIAGRSVSPSRQRCRSLRVLRKLTPRERALEVFGLLRVWDTEENCGVLVYLLLADRDVEIVADRGIHRVVDDARVAGDLRADGGGVPRRRVSREGVVAGVAEIQRCSPQHFPRTGAGANELPDRPVVL